MSLPQKVHAVLERKRFHGDGVYSLDFSVPKRFTRFKPGQFAHLALDGFDPSSGFWPESRVFSLASAPRSEHISLVFSVKGSFTARMEAELKVGEKYWLKLPYGNFIVTDRVSNNQDIVLIAGGTGIAPFIPFLLEMEADKSNQKVQLHYGFRNNDHFLFRDILTRIDEELEGLSLHLVTESKNTDDIDTGRLSISSILETASMLSDPAFFISGPPEMIGNFRNFLYKQGITKSRIHIDEWE